jgi:alanine racemase
MKRYIQPDFPNVHRPDTPTIFPLVKRSAVLKPTRPTVAEIDLKALAGNLQGIRKQVGSGVRLMGVVKANAYGHGILEVSRFLERRHIDYLGVANAEEGVALRESGIKTPVHVFTLLSAEQAVLPVRYNLEPTICSEESAASLNKHAQRAKRTIPVHLKIDTGMNRIGARVNDLARLLNGLGSMRRIEIKGVYTHFATADWQDKSYSRQQLAEFHKGLDILRGAGIEPELVHCAGSAGILDLPESYFSMVRPGIMMYGYYPSQETSASVALRPILSLKSRVSFVKWIEKGESVSYGRRFLASRRTKIATLPIGYADGYFRLLTGRSFVLIARKKFPIVGTICMDQLMVDVGTTDVRPGDEAVLIGRQGRESISAWDLAATIGTIPYEICTNISSRVPRIAG